MKRFGYIYLLIVMTIVILFQLYVPAKDEAELRAAADLMTERMLVALKEDDYSRFSSSFDEKMKIGFNEAEYQHMMPEIRQALGEYRAKSFVSMEDKGEYIMATYNAEFSHEQDSVVVRLVMREQNGGYVVSGFWLDSPKLRGNG